MESITQFACQFGKSRVDTCNVNGNIRMLDRAWIKEMATSKSPCNIRRGNLTLCRSASNPKTRG